MAPAAITSEPVLSPVPGGWYGSEMAMATESWQVALPDDVREELLGIAVGLLPDRVAADPFQRQPEMSARTRSLIAELRSRLAGPPGFVLLTGFPVRESPELVQAAYWVLGLLVGRPVRQNLDGELICRVENAGRDASKPTMQGYRQPIALDYHMDRCTDLIGLLCVRAARSGGLSYLVSCGKIHNIMLAEHPDLLSVLYQPFPFSLPPFRDKEGNREAAWCDIPVFSRAGEGFASYYTRQYVTETQRRPGVPRLTEEQEAALDAVDEIIARPGVPLQMELRPGDVQLINNLHILHARSAYTDDAPDGSRDRGRLLLRLHLAFEGSPALPADYSALLGATGAGAYRGGLWRTPEVRERLGTPVRESRDGI